MQRQFAAICICRWSGYARGEQVVGEQFLWIKRLLERYPGIQTTDAEKLRAILFDQLGATYFNLPDGQKTLSIDLRWCQRDNVTVVSSACDSATDVKFAPSTFVRQYFELNPTANLKFGLGSQAIDLSASSPPVLIPANTSFRVQSKSVHDIIVLRIEQNALNRQMECLLGKAISEDVKFECSIRQSTEKQQAMRQAVLQFTAELSLLGPTILPLAQIELERALVIKFLLFNEHSLSECLSIRDGAPSVMQLRRVEDYLEAHWSEPLDMEALVNVSGVSARTIFRHFKKVRGLSPREFVKSVRLKHVQRMLMSAGPEASVAAIALACGFQSLGHFSREYRLAFGEHPSETLRKRDSSVK